MPPARTGVADYAAALLAALRKIGTVELAPARADVRLYHVANNVIHRDIYARALAEPGVVTLHDAMLQHLFLGTLGEQAYVAEFVYNYGEWSRHLAVDLWHGRSGSGLRPEYYRYPMLKRLAERSLAIVVHNPAAARLVHAHAPAARVIEIPFLFTPPELPSPAEAIRIRQQLCSAPFLFGLFGYLRESKRVAPALRAFRAVRAERPDTAFLLAGEFLSRDLAGAIDPLLRQPGVIRTGYLPERDFWRVACATDACVNLRHPSAGETSAISIAFMGIGKPVLVTSGGETGAFPPDACLRVDSGPAEEEMLARYMLSLRHLSGFGAGIGRRAADHIARYHSVEQVAGLYWNLLCAYCRPAVSSVA
jgi:glycosyltransferase involved in cell wall biosynthesis